MVHNYGIQFGIPCNPDRNIEIIGTSEQLTTPQGGFLGSIFNISNKSYLLPRIQKVMLEQLN